MLLEEETCLSSKDASSMLALLSAFVLISTLSTATINAGKPTNQLGLQPMGRGLWSWLLHYFTDGVGVQGYDTSLGALAPPLRLNIHLACILAIWSVLILATTTTTTTTTTVTTTTSTTTTCGWMLVPCAVWKIGILVTTFYGFLCHGIQYWFFPSVSMPGLPRPHKIQRQPQWKPETISLDKTLLESWTCKVAEASHQDTLRKFQQKLTGEAVGRQIWSNQQATAMEHHDTTTTKQHVNEELVQSMACGGRPYQGFNPSINPNSGDVIFRAQRIRTYLQRPGNVPPPSTTTNNQPTTVKETAKHATHFYSMLQTDDGHWAGDYGGPHFLMPGLVTAWYVMGKPTLIFNDEQVELLKHYIIVHQQVDGGWGTHIESPSTMFGSTLMYVALRLLGVDKDHPVCVNGRKFIHQHGGALYTSSWSKLYLCLLGCMEWEGHNSVPPEMWLLPNWFPFHPGRMWCHARMVYLPMGFLYGSRFVYSNAKDDPTIQSLRNTELYCQPYDTIPWMKTRHLIAETDNYSPIPWTMKTLQNMLARYEVWSFLQPIKNYVRAWGMDFSMEYMIAEDLQTNYIDIGPVNKVLNMISMYHGSGGNIQDPNVVKHMMRVQDYLWIAEDGMKMQGYNGSQCWDTSFAAQAMFEANLLDEFPDVACKIWSYLERTQILSTEVSQQSPAFRFEDSNFRNKYYRHISEGGWPFSTSAHGWPISDCTSEGLKATLCLIKTKAVQAGIKDKTLRPISDDRLFKAVNVLLTYQNEDGGWATYENNRGFGWYEQLNPSEVFGDIMIDYSYVECSMAVLTSLVEFHEMYPNHRPADIKHSVDKGRAFLKSIQRPDGSWYGSWACCFSYGMWFGIEGLVKCGEPIDSDCIQSACKFLLRHQRPNGGWGEDFTSCYDKDYAKDGMKAYGDEGGSGVVNTAWALLALSAAKCDDVEAMKRGVQYLIRRQLPCGDWPQEGISGVFNRSVGITYTAYRNVFPIWALGRCSATYGTSLDD